MKPLGQVVDSSSVEQTRLFGQRIGQDLQGGEVIALTGALGTGKTQLVKGLAAGNGEGNVSRVTSPTFTLVHEYAGRVYLYHVDAYRLDNGAELAALGLDEMVGPESAVVIEWAEKVQEILPPDRLTIRFETTGETGRRMTVEPGGPSSERLLERIFNDEW